MIIRVARKVTLGARLQCGYAVPVVCFSVVALFGAKGYRVVRKKENAFLEDEVLT